MQQGCKYRDKEINKTKAFSVTMLRLMTLIETSWHVCQLIAFRRVKQPDSYLVVVISGAAMYIAVLEGLNWTVF